MSESTVFQKFPKIQQPRDARQQLYRREESGKNLIFVGTPKLHGANACVARTKDGVHFQSRNRVVDIQNDSYGFAFAMSKIPWEEFLEVGEYMYGEWAGAGVQKGVAISEGPKTFFVFAITNYSTDESDMDGHRQGWATTAELRKRELPDGVECIASCVMPFYVHDPFSEKSVEYMEKVTLEIEEQCPVAHNFHGISGIGEGLVWRCEEPGFNSSRFWFKTKGDKHQQNAKRTKIQVKIDYGPATEFVTPLVDKRTAQGLAYIKEMHGDPEMKHTGIFIKWMMDDIFEEEEITVEPKQVKSVIGKMAARWYKENYCD
jgi:hypothetical protein